jgi:hypothetical protein
VPQKWKPFRLPDPPQDLMVKVTCNHGGIAATKGFWLGYFVAILSQSSQYQRDVSLTRFFRCNLC